MRTRQKKTVGRLKFTDVVYLEKEKIDGKEQIFATCTCNQWRSSAEATTILKVANEAKAHVDSGPCELRSHTVEEGEGVILEQDPDDTYDPDEV